MEGTIFTYEGSNRSIRSLVGSSRRGAKVHSHRNRRRDIGRVPRRSSSFHSFLAARGALSWRARGRGQGSANGSQRLAGGNAQRAQTTQSAWLHPLGELP